MFTCTGKTQKNLNYYPVLTFSEGEGDFYELYY